MKNLKINELSLYIHELNRKWWYDKNENKIERNKGELIALMHSELSELMEGERKNLMDTHLPNRKMAEVEIADTIIRLLDYASGFGYDVENALIEKLEYNKNRQDHSYEARERADGKKW